MARNEQLGQEILALYEVLSNKRKRWEPFWQLVASFMRGNSHEFTISGTRGQRLDDEIRSSDGSFASQALSSALIGMLWPSGGQSFQIIKADALSDSQEVIEYFQKATQRLQQAIDDPKANSAVAINEYMLDQVDYGTSGLGIFEGTDSHLRFEAWGTSNLFIAEGDGGRVDTAMRHLDWGVNRVVMQYGIKNVSEKMRERFKDSRQKYQSTEIIQSVRPRESYDPTKRDNKNFPFESVIMEKDTKHIIRERGFFEMPVPVARQMKHNNEEYGRSSGIQALSDIMEQDFLVERFSVGAEKSVDPTLVVLDSGALGGGIIDTSPGAIISFDGAGHQGNNIDPLKPLFTVGDLSVLLNRVDKLEERIARHYFLDKILDLGGSASMTAREVTIRDRIRAEALGSIFTRQIAEMFDPLITRCFNILLRKGALGVPAGSAESQVEGALVIPDEITEAMAAGEDIYKIKYFTPAARMMKIQKSDALEGLTIYTQQVAQAAPEVLDLVDADKAVKLAAETAGLNELLRGDDEVDAIRAQRAEAAKQQQQAAMMMQAAQAAGAEA